MQKYKSIKNLSAIEFRRLTGIHFETFQEMVSLLKKAEVAKKAKGGKPNHLTIQDRLLMALEYLREYRTYFHLSKSYGLSESACYRTVSYTHLTLPTNREV